MTVRETRDYGFPKVPYTKWLHGERYAVAFEVEALQPPDDHEPSIGPDVRAFIGEARRHLDAGDVEWLRRHGRVYVALDDAA